MTSMTVEFREELIKAMAAGLSDEEISANTGVTAATVATVRASETEAIAAKREHLKKVGWQL